MNNTRLKAIWFTSMRNRGLSEITIKGYHYELQRFDKYLGEKSYLSLNLSDIQSYFKTRSLLIQEIAEQLCEYAQCVVPEELKRAVDCLTFD